MMASRLLVCLLFAGGLLRAAGPAEAVFEASPDWPADFTPRLKPAASPAILRHLTVEERVGEPRTDELVRVPLFLHDDEPNNPAAWALFAETDTARRQPLVFQVDDIRRNERGQLTRCHLYFFATLSAWERRRYVLVPRTRETAPPPPSPEAASCTRSGDRVALAGRDLTITFLTSGPRAGALTGIRAWQQDLHLPAGWIAPELTLVRQAADCSRLRTAALSYDRPDSFEVRAVHWGAGPLFAKFAVRIGPPGQPDSAEFIYRVPARGTVVLQTQRLAPEGPPSPDVSGAEGHAILAGPLRFSPESAQPEIVRVPAGLRRLTRTTIGHSLEALVDRGVGLALLPVPGVQTGGISLETTTTGDLRIPGPACFRRHPASNSATLRAFWGETRLAFTTATDPESLWHLARAQFQPLVAIVDEPDLGPADYRAAMPELAQRFREIQQWSRNWAQDAAILWLARDRARYDALSARKPTTLEGTVDFHKPSWARAHPPLPRNPKDQGRIDPYHLAYGSSTIPLYHRLAPNPRLPATARAIGRASHEVFGRVNTAGFPRIDCFASAFNMQLGPLGLALFGGRETGDTALATWARDALHAPGVTGIYGHGQRPYPGEIGRAEASDFLYQAISDLHLRSLELATGEDLWTHPAALYRYFDCVDVTADLQHRPAVSGASPGWSRANFFRGQAHDHRWEAWSCGPLAGLLGRPSDQGRIGSTEAAYWIQRQARGRQSWAELLWYAHADLLLETAGTLPSPAQGPELPAEVSVRRTGAGNQLGWRPVPDVSGYRIYRARQSGGPWTWLNSPYTGTTKPPLVATSFLDSDGSPDDVYLVTAVDRHGRESRWYADEPARR